MVNLGIKAYAQGTESYHILLIIDPKAPAASATPSVASTPASTSEVTEPAYVPSYQRVTAAACKTDVESYKKPSPLDFSMSIRMFVNTNSRILSINGRAKPNFNHTEQLTITSDAFIDYTFSDLKKALPDTWPKLEAGG